MRVTTGLVKNGTPVQYIIVDAVAKHLTQAEIIQFTNQLKTATTQDNVNTIKDAINLRATQALKENAAFMDLQKAKALIYAEAKAKEARQEQEAKNAAAAKAKNDEQVRRANMTQAERDREDLKAQDRKDAQERDAQERKLRQERDAYIAHSEQVRRANMTSAEKYKEAVLNNQAASNAAAASHTRVNNTPSSLGGPSQNNLKSEKKAKSIQKRR